MTETERFCWIALAVIALGIALLVLSGCIRRPAFMGPCSSVGALSADVCPGMFTRGGHASAPGNVDDNGHALDRGLGDRTGSADGGSEAIGGRPCIRCPLSSACVDPKEKVYCVRNGMCDDPACVGATAPSPFLLNP